MKRKIVVSLLAVVVAISNASLHAACRQQRVRNVQHHHAAETKFAVPFAVPVAVPVAVVSPYFYGYSQYEDRGARDVGREAANQKSSPLDPHSSSLTQRQYEDRGARDVGRAEANLKSSSLDPRSSSLLARHCVTCHGGPSPQGQLSLERVEKLSLAERLAAIREVLSRRMPKGGRLSDEQLHGIVEELSSYE
jgi:hypothetical protein